MKEFQGRLRWMAGAAVIAAALAAPPLPRAAGPSEKPPPPAGAGPVVEIVDADGVRRAVEAARGKVVILNFWATWCDPCREELPDIIRFASENASRVVLITVSLDDPGDVEAKVRPFLLAMKAPGRALVKGRGDPDAFIGSVDPKWSGALPATFIHAPDGRRVQAVHGPTSYESLKAMAAPLLPPAR